MRRSTGSIAALSLAAVVSLFSVGSAAADAGAKADRSHIPDGGPAPKLNLPKPARFKLSSGATVLVIERHTLPMVAVNLVWPVGESAMPVDKAGLAGLTAGLLDEGTAKHDSIALAEELDGLGTNLEAGSGWDSTQVSVTTLAKNLDRSLDLLAEVVETPSFDPKELERLRAERLTVLLQHKDSASQVASNVFAKVIYGEGTRYGYPSLGTEASLKKISREDIVGHYKQHLRPSTATIIVSGDVTLAMVKKKLERALGAWKDDPNTPVPIVSLPPVGGVSPLRRVVVDRPGAPQSEIRIGEPSVSRLAPDYFPLVVMNSILGGQFSSRLNLNLREKHGYTYGASSGFAFRKQGGPFTVAVAAKTQVTGPSLEESFKELDRIRAEVPTPAEMRLAKDLLERSMAQRFETLGQLTGELASQMVYGLPDDYFATFAKKVEAVTPEQALAAAREHLDPSKMALVVVGDQSVLGPQLDQVGIKGTELVDVEGKATAAARK